MYIADLHIHSRFSRATSKDGNPENLDLWARKKGIQLVGTGDFTHPAWRQELQEKLLPAEDGLYVLKKEYRIGEETAGEGQPRFVVTGEISSIYKKKEKVRKVHNLILLPGLEEAEALSRRLEAIGNIHSDGRPILGLDCRDLLEIVLEVSPEAMLVPAHIWTPHFSMFGAFSGFDSVEECFEDMAPYIHAVETGLSSDPPMNWRVSALDKYQLISNSDAHSPGKLGREANLLEGELSYRGLEAAVQKGDGLFGTIEFFPEEGKYHFDGHRKCNLCLSPREAERCHNICPVCGKKLTVGVSHRVEELADREEGFVPEGAKHFESLVPLPEVIGASTGNSAAGKKTQEEYARMLQSLGPEFEILRNIPVVEIRKTSGPRIAEGIRRLREEKVERFPGFDGEYGKIQLFSPEELENIDGQMSFTDCFGLEFTEEQTKRKESKENTLESAAASEETVWKPENQERLNENQEQAAVSRNRATAVAAGPGTGKTKTLIAHLEFLTEERRVRPDRITAVTFTNQAAQEMKRRLEKKLGKRSAGKIQIGTFHSICLKILQKKYPDWLLAEEGELFRLAGEVLSQKPVQGFLQMVSDYKTGRRTEELPEEGQRYIALLKERKLWDFDDLLAEGLALAEAEGGGEAFQYLLVDEFQDISPLQYRLALAWNRGGGELFVIGDPDQSIYGFRGSDARCFEKLKEEIPELREVRLKENYRSSAAILRAARKVINENPGGDRELLPRNGEGAPVRIVHAESPVSEAIFAAREISRQVGGIDMLDAHQKAGKGEERRLRSFSEIAVLYRTHRQAELLEFALKKEGIPYMVAGREEFLKNSLVQGTLGFFQFLRHPEDETAKQICLEALWELGKDELSEAVLLQTAEKFRRQKKKKPAKLIGEWMEEIQAGQEEAMKKLQNMAAFYGNMDEFLDALRLGVESDLKRMGGKAYTADMVTLMTMHGAKGLEFPAVILVGARKGLAPYESGKHPADQEEERRLFYVGMTRAKEELILTYSGEASPYLDGLEETGAVLEKAGKKKKQEEAVQMSLFDLM